MSTASGPWVGARVAILYGGESNEREISLKTGKAFNFALLELGYKHVELIDATSAGLLQIASNPPDVALLALHGGLGENGALQGLLECLQIPYTGGGVKSCAVAFDKNTTKTLWQGLNLPTPAWEVFSRKEVEAILARDTVSARVPCVVKPISSGSSVGVTLVREAEAYYGALESALESPGSIMIEALIEGRELTVGLMDGQVMGIIEINPKRAFYDYEAKYGDAGTDYLLPAPISAKLAEEVRLLSEKACAALGARGVARLDLMLDEDDRPWLLELNTTPGMTETSLVPKLAESAGLSFAQFTQMMLNKAALDSDVDFE